MLRKQGVKIFADGTPWLGTIATSFPSLDTEPVRASGFPMGPHPAERALNYDRDEFDRLLGPAAAAGLQVACPVNGDLAIDFVLDAYEVTLERHDLLDGQIRCTRPNTERTGAGSGMPGASGSGSRATTTAASPARCRWRTCRRR